jgi:16S rRNA (guanine527-N7)-methyltransferase
LPFSATFGVAMAVQLRSARPRSGYSPEPMTEEQFTEITGVSRETRARLRAYLEALTAWQARINLVGASTLVDPWRRHFLDSAQLAPLLPAEARIIVDLGSGAGFPGLVLAILRPSSVVHLVESDARKCAFLHEAARATGSAPTIHHSRIETIQPFACDAITSRALAPLDRLLGFASPFLELSPPEVQCLFLKGIGAAQELTRCRKGWKMRVERIPSRSDPTGAILGLREVRRADAG